MNVNSRNLLILIVFGIIGLVFGYCSYFTITAAVAVGLSCILIVHHLLIDVFKIVEIQLQALSIP